MALDGEPPQAIALVLSALPSNLSTNVLVRLPEQTGLKAIWKMTKPGEVSAKTTRRVGEMICRRLVELTSGDGAAFEEVKPKETLRKVAIVLSGLEKEKREKKAKELAERKAIERKRQALADRIETMTEVETEALKSLAKKNLVARGAVPNMIFSRAIDSELMRMLGISETYEGRNHQLKRKDTLH